MLVSEQPIRLRYFTRRLGITLMETNDVTTDQHYIMLGSEQPIRLRYFTRGNNNVLCWYLCISINLEWYLILFFVLFHISSSFLMILLQEVSQTEEAYSRIVLAIIVKHYAFTPWWPALKFSCKNACVWLAFLIIMLTCGFQMLCWNLVG